MNLLRIWQYLQRIIHVYFSAIPGQYENKKLKHLRYAYQEVNRFLHQANVDYWLDFGTLLGFYRENDILPHEIDVDFGVHEKYFDTIISLKNKLPTPFRLFDTSQNHRGPKIYISYKGFDIDLYFYEDNRDLLRSYEQTKFPSESSPLKRNMVFPLTETTFLNEKTFVPSMVKEYLEHYYQYLGRDAVRDMTTGYWKKKETAKD